MKKVLFLMMLSVAMLTACSSDKAAQEKKDSIDAAAKADSMLQAELAADTVVADTAAVDTLKK